MILFLKYCIPKCRDEKLRKKAQKRKQNCIELKKKKKKVDREDTFHMLKIYMYI
jgi:hypothetical protein